MGRRDKPGRDAKKLPKKEREAKLLHTRVIPSPTAIEVIKTKGKKESAEATS